MVRFSLGCYESQLGDCVAAKAHLDKAIELEPACRLAATEDTDYRPLLGAMEELSSE